MTDESRRWWWPTLYGPHATTTSSTTTTTSATCSDQARGMALYAAGITSASVTALTARLMHDEGLAVHFVVLGRAIFGLLLTAFLLWHKGVENPWGYRKGMLCLRALMGMGAIYSFFVTASYLPLADTAVPSFVAPLITTTVAAAALGERPHWGGGS